MFPEIFVSSLLSIFVENLAAAKADANVQKHIAGKQIIREIVVPGRLVNLVVK